MITDRNLMKLSLVVSLVGTIALIVFIQFIEPKQITASELENNIGNNVIISGVVTSYSENKGNVFIDLNNSTKIVMFSSEAERRPDIYKMKAGDNISVTGKVQLYRGRPEIIAKYIRKIQ